MGQSNPLSFAIYLVCQPVLVVANSTLMQNFRNDGTPSHPRWVLESSGKLEQSLGVNGLLIAVGGEGAEQDVLYFDFDGDQTSTPPYVAEKDGHLSQTGIFTREELDQTIALLSPLLDQVQLPIKRVVDVLRGFVYDRQLRVWWRYLME